MLFASLPFLLGFLPLVIAGTVIARQRMGTRGVLVFLSLASMVFYGWHYPPYVLLLITTVFANYFLAHRLYANRDKAFLGVAVALNLALLGWFKYAGFFAGMVEAIVGTAPGIGHILLPLGISFFTFQQIAYLVDIYQGKTAPGKLLEYVFFITFFPQLIAGPIVHHQKLIPQLSEQRFAQFLRSDVTAGAFLFCIGLAKKVLIADSLRIGADSLFLAQSMGMEISMGEAWLGMICYTFQIYFDFSGYTDMALGLGLIFGLKLPENFRSPYKSLDIIDFWRRWNITLSHFLRDYLYVPLGGNQMGPVRRYANLWIVMLLGGLWHGAGWQFVVWGGLHGFYLSVAHGWRRFSPYRLPVAVSLPLTFVCVVIAWVFFRAATFTQAFDILLSMSGLQGTGLTDIALIPDLSSTLALLAFAALLVWFTPNALSLTQRLGQAPVIPSYAPVCYSALGVLAAVALLKTYASGSYAFIYFQF